MIANSLRVFSTFTGIGGFEIGIQNASVGKCNVELVGYSEIDKYASMVFDNNFNGVKNYGDITKIKAEALPDFDCLVGGFPCQAFSIAGRRAGFDDTRGTLFFDLARILRAKRPRLFVFENVKGLLNHDGGRTFRVIIATIAELGYDCQWQVLNSKNFGVPQNRERIYIVGHLRGTARPQVFPIRSSDQETINPASEKGQLVDLTFRQPNGYRVRKDERAGTLDANYYKGIANQERPGVLTGSPVYVDGKRQMRYKVSDQAPTIRATQHKSGDNQPKIVQRPRGKNNGGHHDIAPTLTGKSYQDNNHVVEKPVILHNIYGGFNEKKPREFHDVSPTIRTAQGGGHLPSVMQGATIRRLTPLECERLQAFPDNWTQVGSVLEGKTVKVTLMSDTQRYKMCGNAVTTNVVQAVFERIIKSL